MSEIVHHNGLINGNLRFDDGSSNVITLATPSISSDYTLTLPVNSGSVDQILKTNGSGVMSWTDQPSVSVSTGSVTQTGNIGTAVTLNTMAGVISLYSSGGLLSPGGQVAFTLNNSNITTSSIIFLTFHGSYFHVHVALNSISTGNCAILISNTDIADVTFNVQTYVNFHIIN